MALARAIWRIADRGDPERRRWFWRLLRIAVMRGIPAVTRAVEFSIMGEHFIRYTAEEVLLRLSPPVRKSGHVFKPPAAWAGAAPSCACPAWCLGRLG